MSLPVLQRSLGRGRLSRRFDGIASQIKTLEPRPSVGIMTTRTTRGVIRRAFTSVWEPQQEAADSTPRYG